MIWTKDGQTVKLSPGQVTAVVLASVLVVCATGAAAYAALTATGRFASHGQIVAIGLQVFQDAALTTEAKTEGST